MRLCKGTDSILSNQPKANLAFELGFQTTANTESQSAQSEEHHGAAGIRSSNRGGTKGYLCAWARVAEREGQSAWGRFIAISGNDAREGNVQERIRSEAEARGTAGVTWAEAETTDQVGRSSNRSRRCRNRERTKGDCIQAGKASERTVRGRNIGHLTIDRSESCSARNLSPSLCNFCGEGDATCDCRSKRWSRSQQRESYCTFS